MVRLFLDIETLPCEEGKKEEVIKLLQTKNGAAAEVTEEIIEKLYRDTSFEGTFGRICCIGYIKEDGRLIKGVLRGDEKEILAEFWKLVKDVNLFIGHNLMEFDLPFIYKRSVILGVKPTLNLPFIRYRSFPIFDTMKEWNKWGYGKSTSLDTLAKVLGFPSSKDEMNGSMVWDYYKQGKVEEICKYCMKDVELTRRVFYKMNFEEMVLEEEDQELAS